MSDRWKGKTQHNHNVNNTATRNIHGGSNSMFSGNIFGGTFNIDVVNEKKLPPPKKHWRITWLRQSINASNKNLNYSSNVLYSWNLLFTWVYQLLYKLYWSRYMTADFGWFPDRFSMTYWLTEWRREYFIQMKYLLAQMKIIIPAV